jgi:DNA modification methylase
MTNLSDHVINDILPKGSPAYVSNYGAAYIGDSIDLLNSMPDDSIDLVMTSPPFALLRKKEYGNSEQSEYVEWLGAFANAVYPKLKPTGSFVVDIGGAYQKGTPTRSLYNLEFQFILLMIWDIFLLRTFTGITRQNFRALLNG